MSAENHHRTSVPDSPEATSTLGRARDKLAEWTGLSAHEGRRFISPNKPLRAIEYLEVRDLEALAVYFEAAFGLANLRRPALEESLAAWVAEVEQLLVVQSH